MFLIAGCPRGGTKYTALILRRLGYDVGHEKPGSDGIVTWRFIGMPADVVLHQVRDPLATIGSLTTIQDYSWRYICQHTPIDLFWPLERRCAETWLYWNRMAQGMASLTYRIESLPQIWDEWCDHLNVTENYTSVMDIPTDTHHRVHASWTWEQVERATPLADDIRLLAEAYGYETR